MQSRPRLGCEDLALISQRVQTLRVHDMFGSRQITLPHKLSSFVDNRFEVMQKRRAYKQDEEKSLGKMNTNSGGFVGNQYVNDVFDKEVDETRSTAQ